MTNENEYIDTSAPQNDAGQIAAHVPCVTCRYDLFMQTNAENCPQCGMPVRMSTVGLLRFANPKWVNDLANGVIWAFSAACTNVVFGLAVGIIAVFAGMSQMSQTMATSQPSQQQLGGAIQNMMAPISWVGIGINAIVTILLMVGIWHLARPKSDYEPEENVPFFLSLVRKCLWLIPIGFVCATAAGISTLSNCDYSNQTAMAEWFSSTGGKLTSVGTMLGGLFQFLLPGVAVLGYLGYLMKYIPKPGLVTFAKTCWIGMAVCGGLVLVFQLVQLVTGSPVAQSSSNTIEFSPAMILNGAMGCVGCVSMLFAIAAFIFAIMAAVDLKRAAREANEIAGGVAEPGNPYMGPQS